MFNLGIKDRDFKCKKPQNLKVAGNIKDIRPQRQILLFYYIYNETTIWENLKRMDSNFHVPNKRNIKIKCCFGSNLEIY